MKRKMFLVPLLALVISACSGNPSTSTSFSEPSSESSSSSVYVEPRPEEFLETDLYTETMTKLGEYTPTTFQESTLEVVENIELYDGVNYIVYSFLLNNNNNKVYATTLEIDLDKADIRTNYSPGTSDILYNQMTNYASLNTDVDVIAGINADFFGGGTCVNAYIKEFSIVKSGHNDKGIYDYKNLDADIPASMPMLLGVQDKYARIAPIVEDKSVEETIKSKFAYKLMYASEDKVVHQITDSFSSTVQLGTNKLNTNYTFINEPVRLGVAPAAGDLCYVIEMEEGNYKIPHGKVSEIWECDGNRINTDDTVDGYAYLFVRKGTECSIKVGDYVGYVLGNPDGKFDGYGNIIGGRQSLVENGEIAPTVTLENSNGAQSTNIPRSCVGIKDDGKLLICAVEALRYGRTSKSEEDGYGLSLPQLADFLREINCYDAMNFDGGGSTSLITKNLKEGTDYEVKVRSSDYGTYNLNQSRKVYNTLLVTTKTK